MSRLATAKTGALDGLLSHVTLALSGLLFVSPWLLDYSGLAVAAWTAWISAIVIAIFSLAATIHFAEWEEWVALVGGVWLLVAPWALQFAYFGGATVAFTGVGSFIVWISVSDLWAVIRLRHNKARTGSL
jgi:hypothetical protein